MRALVTTISALIVMAAQTQAMDWDTLSVNEDPIPPQVTPSFSIGYPKGWQIIDFNQKQHDIYNVVSPHPVGPSWIFGQPHTANTLKEQVATFYLISWSYAMTAREAADIFFNNKQTATAYTQKSIRPVKTSAGDSGWLVESEGYLIYGPDPALLKNAKASGLNIQLEKSDKPSQKIPVIYHDFFFQSGNLGAIQIQIITQTANASWRSQLDRLVLDTLRFNSP
jgi:hypothetical protein